MSPLDDVNAIEQHLCDLADLRHEPIGGTFELLPLCNMDCKMCYVRMTPDQMKQEGRLLTIDEWTEIAIQAVDAGLLVLLITGGEPFLYPDFLDLYLKLHDMGLIISINTNGTLITEEIASVLGQYPPRRMNITLYGASDETYENLCNNPTGFSKVMNTVHLFEKYNIPFKMNCSVTPYNISDLPAMYDYVSQHNIKFDVAPYMFPPARKANKEIEKANRLTPEQAAQIYYRDLLRVEGTDYLNRRMKSYHEYYKLQSVMTEKHPTSIPCRAGSSTWWINWKGQMTHCGMFEEPAFSVLDKGFERCWDQLKTAVSSCHISAECADCPKSMFCLACAASAHAETGQTDGVPRYQCQMAKALMKLSKEDLSIPDIL